MVTPFAGQKRPIAWLLLFLAGIEAWLRLPLLLGKVALFDRDLFLLYYPLVQSVLRSVSEGAWPLRDPTSAFGQSILGDPESQVLYPLTWLHLILPTHVAYAWFVSIQSVFGALGIALLARRLSGGSLLAAGVGGLMWILSGPLQSLATLWHHMSGAAWIPWVLLGVERVLADRDRRSTILLGTTVGAQILAGSADMCAMTILVVLARIASELEWRLWKHWIASAVIAVLLGIGVWLPATESVLTSGRSALPEATRTFWSLHPLNALEFFLPLPLALLPLKQEWKQAMYGSREPFLGSMFLGAAILPLLAAGLADKTKPYRVRASYGWAAFLGFLVALGKNSAAYFLIVTLLPPLAVLRYPSKAMVPVTIILCVLSGMGVSAIRDSARSRALAAGCAGALSLVSLLLIGPLRFRFESLFDPRDQGGLEQVRRNLPPDLGMTLMILLFLCAFVRWPSRRIFLGVAMLLSARQSSYLLASVNYTVSPNVLGFKPEYLESIRPPNGGRVFVYDYSQFQGLANKHLGTPALAWSGLEKLGPDAGRVTASHAYLEPLTAALWGFEYAWDADLRLLLNRRLARMTNALRAIEDTPGLLRLLQISGVERVVALHDIAPEGLHLLNRYPIFHKEPLRLFEVQDTLPRAHLRSGRQRGTGQDVTDLLDPAFDPNMSVLVDEGPTRNATSSFRGSLQLVLRKADRITLDVSTNEVSFLTLIEGALPGWRAWIDGRAVRVERANVLFIGAEIPPGNHRVEFRFLPLSALIGVSTTLITAVCLILWFATRGRSAVAEWDPRPDPSFVQP